MKKTILLLTILVFVFKVSCASAQNEKEETIARLKSNLGFLASDELEGRYTGSKSEKVASQFIASELKKYGVKHFGNAASYFQDFSIVSKTIDTSSTLTLSSTNNGTTKTEELILNKDFSVWGQFLPCIVDQTMNYQIQFVGYGITAEEYNYDDYAGLDITGRVVVFLSDEPYSEDPVFFNGATPTKYSNTVSKIFLAASHGAAGIIWIVPDRMMNFIDRINQQSFNDALCFPDSSPVKKEFVLPPIILMYPEGAKIFFLNEKMNFDKISEKQKSSVVSEKFTFEKTICFTFKRNTGELKARNVVGIIEGNDPMLKDEYVTISAHFDHLGVTNGQVFNGADDNGSGCVAVMEIVRQLALEKSNARSIIVIFYTGEEEGFLGSSYFAQTFNKISNVIVNLNIDMVGRESLNTLFCVGSDLSCKELNEIIHKKNNEITKFTLDYSNSNFEWLNRSDLVPFYSKKIPVVDFGDNMTMDYHKPSDDVGKINFEKIYKALTLVKSVAIEIANINHRLKFIGLL